MSIPQGGVSRHDIGNGMYRYVVFRRGEEWIAISPETCGVEYSNLSAQGFSIFDLRNFFVIFQSSPDPCPSIRANSPCEAVEKAKYLVEQRIAQLKSDIAFLEGKSTAT